MTETLLIAVPTLPAIASLAIALRRPPGDRASRWAVRATALSFVAAAVVAVVVGADEPISAVVDAADGGAVLGLHADRATALLALLTTGVGLVVQSFAGRALRGDPRERRFFALASLLTAATTSVALAATLGLLTASWIAAGLALAALVGHRGEWAPARAAARRTRRSLLLGDAALLAAAVVGFAAVGEIDLRATATAADELAGSSVLGLSALPIIAVLLAVAGISRSALVPLHRWLPSTIAAPTPVSALLHAGVVNGAGVLLVRLAPVFGASAVATHLAFAAGAVTACYATAVMLVRSDVKGGLAWSTAGQMGFMTVQVAVGAFAAALLHILGHGMYKAALFLGSGGAVTAHLRHRHRPAPHAVPPAIRLATAALAPAAGLWIADAILDPELSTATSVLVTAFAWATAARAVDGWLRSAPLAPAAAVGTGAVGAVVGVLAYLGGLSAVKSFVEPAVPAAVDEAVTATVLVVVLAAIAVAVAVVWLAPSEAVRRLRSRLYVLTLTSSLGAPARPEPAPPAATSR